MDIHSKLATQKYSALKAALQPDKTSESNILKQVQSFAETLGKGEELAVKSTSQPIDPHMLVQALTQSELAVETAVTVRNKVVQAYQDILRMPI